MVSKRIKPCRQLPLWAFAHDDADREENRHEKPQAGSSCLLLLAAPLL